MKFAARSDLARSDTYLLFDLSERGRMSLVGPDARKLLHNMSTNEVNSRLVGEGFEAFLLNAKGSIVDLVTSYVFPDRIALDLEAGRLPAVWKQFDRYIIREQVKLIDHSQSTAHWHVCGEQVPAALTQAWGDRVPDQPYQSRLVLLADQHVELRSHRRSRFPGYDLLFPIEASAQVMQELSKLLGETALLAPTDWMTAFRIEMGWPIVGKEIGDLNLAQEMLRDKSAISFTKGCYIGQETVARLDAMGHVNKTLAGLKFDLPPNGELLSVDQLAEQLPAGSKIKLDGKDLGSLGSVAFSPTLNQIIGLAVLRVFGNQPGTEVQVMTNTGALPAIVTSLPITHS